MPDESNFNVVIAPHFVIASQIVRNLFYVAIWILFF